MSKAGNRKAVLQYFSGLPGPVRDHFEHFPKLVSDKYPLDVALAYLFYRVELAHRDTLYCGVVRLHHVNANMARKAVREAHLTRATFKELFARLFGNPIKESVASKLAAAEKTRDRSIHGSEPTEAAVREATVDLLAYAKEFNEFVQVLAGFPPFGDLRGFHGGGSRLPDSTSRLILRGVGFNLS